MTAPGVATAREAVALLERAVAKAGPEYVYPNATAVGAACVYVEGGAPSCIVGHALALAGYGVDEISRLDTAEEGVVSAGGIPQRSGFQGVRQEAATVFQSAQTTQDGGHSWGEALHHARETATFFEPHDAAGANAS